MDDNFDVDKFIALIQTKESIWNYKGKAYNNKTQRRDDWMSVCEAMVPDFKDKSNGEKCATALEYQAKWKGLRDGFTRSLKNYIKKAETNHKAKLYAYYDQLKFLLDLYEDKTAILNEAEQTKSAGKRRKKRRQGMSTKSPRIEEAAKQVSQQEIPHSSTNMEPINTSYSNPEEDKLFLLSLLSDFRKIPEEQKLDCKGDIINVIRHYRNTSSAHIEAKGLKGALVTTSIEATEDSSRDSSTVSE